MRLKFLHTADWQIGKRYGQFEPDEAALLAEARFEAVTRIAERAHALGADFIVVAGDVFDAQGVSDRTILRLFQCTAGFPGPWVMIPGNHDAGLAESVWSRAARQGAVPPNVHVCLMPEPLVLGKPGVVILPAPLTQRHASSDLTAWFDDAATPEGMPRIGVAHGSVQGILAEAAESTNPIDPGRAMSARLDYLALGDWHGMKCIDDRTWYSGTPETDRFRNNTSGKALFVELAGPAGAPVVEPIPIGRYRWSSLERELQVGSDLSGLIDELAAFGSDDVVELRVTGAIDLEGHLALQRALAVSRARARSLRADLASLRLLPTADDLRALNADGYLGEVIDVLRGQEGGDDAEVARDALAILAGILDQSRERSAGGQAS